MCTLFVFAFEPTYIFTHSKMLKVLLVLALVGAAVAQDCPIKPETQQLDFSKVTTACEALMLYSSVTMRAPAAA